MDGGVERRSQAAAVGDDGGGAGASFEVDSLAAARHSSCAAKRREERDATVQGDGKEICDVEADGHVGVDEGMEDGSYGGRKKAL